MLTLTQQLTERLGEAIQKIQDSNIPEKYSPSVTAATDTRFGDYQSNAAMALAKTLKSREIQLNLESTRSEHARASV